MRSAAVAQGRSGSCAASCRRASTTAFARMTVSPAAITAHRTRRIIS
jgi:hypothetical protein